MNATDAVSPLMQTITRNPNHSLDTKEPQNPTADLSITMAPFTAGEMIHDQTPSNTSARHARAKYRMLSPETKMRAIAHADQYGIKEAASLYKVPTKSLKRWLKVGFL